MKIDTNTLKTLQNFASINPNIVFKEGETVVKTISEQKNIMAEAPLNTPFDSTFGIYDLNEFLSALALVNEPDIEVDGNVVRITSQKSKDGIEYICANQSILTHPSKSINDPEYEVSVNLGVDEINQLKKASSVLGYDHLILEKESGTAEIIAKVCDPQNSSSNVYKKVVATLDQPTDVSFSFVFLIDNLKLIPGDYKVSLSSKLISKWTNDLAKTSYWIAIETTSNYKG